MRITPLDIRKQEFKKSMRGFDSDEVYAFLNTVADEYEAALSDNKRLREHIVDLRERLKEFQSMETNLRNTLLTAEKITSEAKDNARREAGLIVREAEVEAEKAAESIRAHTMQLRREILELKKQKDNYLTRLKTLIDSHHNMIEGFEDDFSQADREIEKLEEKIEQDSREAVPHHRMTRDRITEEFAGKQEAGVEEEQGAGGEGIQSPEAEDLQGGQWKEGDHPAEREAASESESEFDFEARGQAEDRTEESAGAGREAPPSREQYPPSDWSAPSPETGKSAIDPNVPIGEIDANHVQVEDEKAEAADSGKLQRKVVENIEHNLYPDIEESEEDRAAGRSGEPEVDEVDRWSDSVSNTQEPTEAASPADKRSSDQWKDYEMEEGQTDWRSYDIPRTGEPSAERSAAEPMEKEVEEALSGLQETEEAAGAGGEERPAAGVPSNDQAPEERRDPAGPPESSGPAGHGEEPAAEREEEDSSWSMENLRKNLTNISEDRD